jgi:hypothetical protein
MLLGVTVIAAEEVFELSAREAAVRVMVAGLGTLVGAV